MLSKGIVTGLLECIQTHDNTNTWKKIRQTITNKINASQNNKEFYYNAVRNRLLGTVCD